MAKKKEKVKKTGVKTLSPVAAEAKSLKGSKEMKDRMAALRASRGKKTKKRK